ncbi:MAG: hypothetical protein JSS60_08550 [Verrucomicrobia bacterium]|nr:hypothetical protein [Verrucomicrobiota bacterium]
MTTPIGGPSPSQPLPQASSASPNVPQLAQQMQTQATILAEQLQKALDDPSLSTQPSFLQEVTSNGNHLNQTVEQAILVR